MKKYMTPLIVLGLLFCFPLLALGFLGHGARSNRKHKERIYNPTHEELAVINPANFLDRRT